MERVWALEKLRESFPAEGPEVHISGAWVGLMVTLAEMPNPQVLGLGRF